MPELLLELLSEEIPARMQARAAEDLKRLITDRLEKDGLKFESLQTFVTPRRLTLVVNGLPVETYEDDRRGPPKTAPEKAVVGFAKSNGVSVDQLEIRDTGKGEYYFAVVKEVARQTIDHMPLIVSEAVFNLGWPKSMRWHSTAMTWVRQIQSILAVFDGKIVEDVFQLGLKNKVPGLKFAMNDGMDAAPGELEIPISNCTQGHRFLSSKKISVKDFADYEAKLKAAYVILEPVERRSKILTEAKKLARRQNLTVKDDPALLDELTGLVEWPVVLMGYIEDEFMVLPDEVLTTSMRIHQKYISCLETNGTLGNHFIFVTDTKTTDKGKQIIAGNERVLRARLADAKFFWDQDRKETLESRVEDLKERVFHSKLGTDFERTERIATLSKYLAKFTDVDPNDTLRAGQLCKADLTTKMVGEFPELQGVMGRYYVLNDGENPNIADAINEHYEPKGPDDACPTKPISVAVALADKIDSLVGFFAIDENPTGSKDPFALRRSALGVIRLIIENKLRVPLTQTFNQAYDIYLKSADRALVLYASQGFTNEEHKYEIGEVVSKYKTLNYDSILLGKTHKFTISRDIKGFLEEGFIAKLKHHNQVTAELLDFFASRLKVHLRYKGVRHDLISAVFAVRQAEQEVPGEVDLIRVLSRVDALDKFLNTDDGDNLLTAYRRAANIVRIEEKKDEKRYPGNPVEKHFEAAEETSLNKALTSVEDKTKAAIEDEDFVTAMTALAGLRKPVDVFFDNVTVNCENFDLRVNRLELLSRIRWTMDQVADFSCIEGGER